MIASPPRETCTLSLVQITIQILSREHTGMRPNPRPGNTKGPGGGKLQSHAGGYVQWNGMECNERANARRQRPPAV